MTKEQIAKLEEAEDILLCLYFEIRDERGCASQAKKLDTILGKIYNLKHSVKS